MRNVVMAMVLVVAGVSSSYVSRPGDSDSSQEATAKDKVPSAETASSQPIDDPLRLVWDFLRPVDAANSGPEPHPNFLLATIPDPERTHLGLSFDRYLEAIIDAAEAAGFSYDRYWLPWHVNHDVANPDPEKQDILDKRAEERRRKPGVIIFRKRPGPQKQEDLESDLEESTSAALVVFLIGETPTAGVNRHQFKNAADYIRSFKKRELLGVLGPTFSGSSTSLLAALKNDLPEVLPDRVISGAASGRRALAGLAASTIHSSASLRASLWEFPQLSIRGKVAVLTEAATDAGVAVREAFDAPGRELVYISYPREISRLRNAYPEQKSSPAAQLAKLEQQLFLRLRDSRAGEDTLPQFSDQTPLTQESILLEISETLRRDRVGLAIITGTDALDFLFLSRHLRELSPDVRLAILDSDILFVHGTDTLDFSGILALTTYPPTSPTWPVEPQNYGPSHRYYFASNKTEGVYNACVFLLNRIDPARPVPRDYSSPQGAGSATPPVWLSIVGRDAYWPLALWNSPGTGMRQAKVVVEGRFDPGEPTRAWSFVFYICSLLASLFVGIYLYVLLDFHLLHGKTAGGLPRWCSLLHPHPYAALPSRAGYSFLFSLALLLAYGSLLAPVFRIAFEKPDLEWLTMRDIGCGVFLLLLVALALGLIWLPRWIMILAAVLGYGAAKMLIESFHAGSRDPESFFRALRSVQLGSGVGPDLPLVFLFLACAWWASMQVQRARLVAEQQPELANIAEDDAGVNIAILNNWFKQRFLYVDPCGWALVAPLAAVVTAVVARTHVISVDGRLFETTVCALLIVLSTLLFMTTYAFARIWLVLERLLKALEMQPIRFAFSNLPSDVSWSPLWQSGARRKSYTTLIRSLESLRALEKCEPSYYPQLSADIVKLEADVTRILTPANQGIEEPITATAAAQTHLAGITKRLSAIPKTKDWKRNHSESLEKLKKESGSPTVHKGKANWFDPSKPADFEITSATDDSRLEDKAEMLAAEIIALRYLAYIRYVMRHLRNLLSFITTGFILMTLALNCYPFQMLNLIRWSITIVFILIAVVLLYAFQEMSRNEILSRITDTKAGSLDAGFYTRVLSVGALPVVAVVASHFPSIGRFLFSWVQPAISAVH